MLDGTGDKELLSNSGAAVVILVDTDNVESVVDAVTVVVIGTWVGSSDVILCIEWFIGFVSSFFSLI